MMDAEPQRTCYFLSGTVDACTNPETGVVEEECLADGADRCVFRRREE